MKKGATRTLVENRKARFDYEILETFEAGIELKGSEVKSIRQGKVSIKGAYADIQDGEVYLIGMHIAPYDPSGNFGHDPLRPKKLLLHKREIKRLIGKVKERGLTLVPLRVYLKGHLVKVELALVRGKRKYDKREEIKRRELEREAKAALKRAL